MGKTTTEKLIEQINRIELTNDWEGADFQSAKAQIPAYRAILQAETVDKLKGVVDEAAEKSSSLQKVLISLTIVMAIAAVVQAFAALVIAGVV